MDGSQTPGINYNSIDGLTTVNATTISINGSTINLDSYVPYINATSTVNLNTQTLTNIANASAFTDAVNLQTMNAKRFIGDATFYIESLSGGLQNEVFTLKSDYGSGILCAQEDYTSKYLYNQKIQFFTSAYAFCGSIIPGSIGVLGISATNLNLTGAIAANGIITSNGSQIKNIADGTLSQDATTVSQVSTSIGGRVPYSGAISNVDLNAKQLKNILDGTLSNDAISLGQLLSYVPDRIYNLAQDCSVTCGLSNLVLMAGPIGTINLLSRTTIQPTSNGTDIFIVKNAAGTSIFSVDTLTSAISCNTVVNANSNKIINLATATNAADAVRFDQLPAAIPAGSVQGSYIVYNSGAYINNATNSINLGLNTYSISPSSINIGHSAGAGNSGSVSDTVNIGQSTGSSGQASQTVAIGSNAGATSQGFGAVAIGYKAQRDNVTGGGGSVSIGSFAGSHDIGDNCVGVGGYAGYEGQRVKSVAIGYQAGHTNQGITALLETGHSIAIGESAGYTGQSAGAIAIGWNCAPTTQGGFAIAIGVDVAGATIQGNYSIGIGYLAAYNISADNSIILNAQSAIPLDASGPGFFVAPIRITPIIPSPIKGLMYKTDIKEIVYQETTIWNVIIIGQATSNPSATVPLVYFMPVGQAIVPGVSYAGVVARASQGVYDITFPSASSPNFGTYTTITTGMNTAIVFGSDLVTAFVTALNIIQINYVLANVAFRDLQLNVRISLRIEF